MKRPRHPRTQFLLALLFSSLISVLLFAYGAIRNRSGEFSYLMINLFLAWLPLLFATWLMAVLRRKRWSSWEGLAASALWLLFLPNSFYMVSDFIHLQDYPRVSLLYDSVMFTAFIFVGFVLGLASLYMVHRQFAKRISWQGTTAWLTAILLLCGFAIYLGRDLRWNSWDLLTNPGGLLFDISDRLIHPSAYPDMFLTTFIFFALIGSLYTMVWKGAQLIRTTDM